MNGSAVSDDRHHYGRVTASTIGAEPRSSELEALAPEELVEFVGNRILPERFAARRYIGRGGMGVVIECHDRMLERDVAVKVVSAHPWEDDAARLRFLREARAAATLRHAGIVTVHDVDPDG